MWKLWEAWDRSSGERGQGLMTSLHACAADSRPLYIFTSLSCPSTTINTPHPSSHHPCPTSSRRSPTRPRTRMSSRPSLPKSPSCSKSWVDLAMSPQLQHMGRRRRRRALEATSSTSSETCNCNTRKYSFLEHIRSIDAHDDYRACAHSSVDPVQRILTSQKGVSLDFESVSVSRACSGNVYD